MPGYLLQLVAHGIEEDFIIKNPQITFFKIIYRRHSNFSLDTINQYFSVTPQFGKKVSATISKNGDLLNNLLLRLVLPEIPQIINDDGSINPISKVAWIKNIGYAMINNIEITIGETLIDRQYGEYMNLIYELCSNKYEAIKKMIGDVPELTEFTNGKNSYILYIPLKFWFCGNEGLAVPLVSLQFHEVKINLELKPLENCLMFGPNYYIEMYDGIVNFIEGEYIYQNVNPLLPAVGKFLYFDTLTKYLYYQKITEQNFLPLASSIEIYSINGNINEYTKYVITGYTSTFAALPNLNSIPALPYNFRSQITIPSIGESYLVGIFTYLDEHERLLFYKNQLEYLITTTDIARADIASGQTFNLKLNMNQLCKYIIWIGQLHYLNNMVTTITPNCFNYTNNSILDADGNPQGTSMIKCSRLILNGQERIAKFDYKYYNFIQSFQNFYSSPNQGINIYSFSMYPLLLQPSGAINMSLIDTIMLDLTLDESVSLTNKCDIRVYYCCYNIYKVQYGIGGLMFVD